MSAGAWTVELFLYFQHLDYHKKIRGEWCQTVNLVRGKDCDQQGGWVRGRNGYGWHFSMEWAAVLLGKLLFCPGVWLHYTEFWQV